MLFILSFPDMCNEGVDKQVRSHRLVMVIDMRTT
jgi:hypothetical protein